MSRDIRDERQKLLTMNIRLRELANLTRFTKSQEIRKEQEETFKKWRFYDKFIKATDKMNNKIIYNPCSICGEPINDFDDYGIYGGEYCEECFKQAQESRLK